jgi:hypothetical protein
LLDWQREGCFVGEDGGQVVASVTTTPFCSSTAWLGMLLVDQPRRREGIARTLLFHAVGWLAEHGVASVALDATPLGKTLYDQAGFRDVYTLQRQHLLMSDVHWPPSVEGLRRLQADDFPRLNALDAAAFHALDRAFLLRDLWSAHAAGCWLKEDASGNVQGYVLSRPGARAWYVGPLVAYEEAVADMLLASALAGLAGKSVTIDTLDPNPFASALVARYGFAPVRPFIRMVRGSPLQSSRSDWYFAMAGPELG